MRFVTRILAALTLSSVLLAGCGGAPAPTTAPAPSANNPAPAAPPEDGQLVISTFGFGADLVQKNIIDPFAQKYGVKVTVETGTNADRLTKLQANKAAPVVDVMLITDYFAQIGINQGLFDKVDPAQIPNLKNTYDFAPSKDGYGPIYTVNRLGLAYRTDKVKNPPTSWKDLWNPEYKGLVALPDLNISFGIPFLAATAKTWGKDDKDTDAAFKALAQVKPNVLKIYGKSSEMNSLLQRGEAVIAPAADIFLVDQLKANAPIQWVVPKEGSYLISNVAEVVKGTKRKQTAEKFIDFLLSKEVQEVAAKTWYDAPVNKDAKVDASVAPFLASGADALKSFGVLDQAFVVQNRDQWLDRFMREVAQ